MDAYKKMRQNDEQSDTERMLKNDNIHTEQSEAENFLKHL